MDEEAKKYCSNCKKDVAEQNSVLHMIHCQRYMQICELCDEPVPKKEIDDHIEEFHSQVSCEKCDLAMERWEIEEHATKCAKRLETCEFCEISLDADELMEHKSYCGSRSERCPDCKKSVLVKENKFHHLVCFSDSGQKPKKIETKCSNCGNVMDANSLEKHKNLCSGYGRFMEYRQRKKSTSSSDTSCTTESSNIDEISQLFRRSLSLKDDQNLRFNDGKKNLSLTQNRTTISGSDYGKLNICIVCEKKFLASHNGSCFLCNDCKALCGDDTESKTDYNSTTVDDGKVRARSTNSKREIEKYQCVYCEKIFTPIHEDSSCTACSACEMKCSDGSSSTNRSGVFSAFHKDEDCVEREVKMHRCMYCDDYFTPVGEGSSLSCSSCRRLRKHQELKKKSDSKNSSAENNEQSLSSDGSSNGVRRKREYKNLYTYGKNDRSPQNDVPKEENSIPSKDGGQKKGTKNWTGLLTYFERSNQHSKEVASFKPPCLTCKKRFNMNEIDDHMKTCPLKIEACPVCDKEFKLGDLETHASLCLEESEKLGKQDFNLPKEVTTQLTRAQKKKLSKKKKAEIKKEAIDYVSGRSYSDMARGAELMNRLPTKAPMTPSSFTLVDELLPCEFCNKNFPSSDLIFHQSGCRPDLLHYPEFNSEEITDNVLDEYKYAMARPVRSTASAQEKNSDQWEKKRIDINKEATRQNACNTIKQHVASVMTDKPGFNESRFAETKSHQNAQSSEDSDKGYSASEGSQFQLRSVIANTYPKSISSGTPLQFDDPAIISISKLYPQLLRGRGRARPIDNAPLPRPGEFLSRSKNAIEKSPQKDSGTVDAASISPMKAQQSWKTPDRSSENGIAKRQCLTESASKAPTSHAYKFEDAPDDSNLNEVVNNMPWKCDYSKNLLQQNEIEDHEKTTNITDKISRMNIALDDNAVKTRNKCNNIDDANMNSMETEAASPATPNTEGMQVLQFTASANNTVATKRSPLSSHTYRSLRRSLQQLDTSKSNR